MHIIIRKILFIEIFLENILSIILDEKLILKISKQIQFLIYNDINEHSINMSLRNSY